MPSKKLKVGTWNVNSIKVRLPRLLAFLQRESPDILCLQELKCEELAFPFQELAQAGYVAHVFGQKTYNGVAILSKEPLSEMTKGFDDGDEENAARFVGGTTQEGLRVYSAYVPNGQEVGSEKYLYKLKWLRRMKNYLSSRSLSKSPLLVCGDYNIAPEDRDIYDPLAWRGQILCSERERKSLREILDLGFEDLFRLFEKGPGHYTWWDYRQLAFQKNLGLRIDLLLANSACSKICREVVSYRDERKGEKPSDHIPVIASLSL